ncbi:MAG: acetylxylan esterase [Verrucomicrobiota bacterium]
MPAPQFRLRLDLALAFCWLAALAAFAQPVPPDLHRWLAPQTWQRDTDGPVISLGHAGAFDDTHLFAPCVDSQDNVFRLWYCGSRGKVEERVFDLGLATSKDGRAFEKFANNPVFRFGDGKHSILTPTILRDGGKLRMWFSATDFVNGKGLHTLHESSSTDGIQWSPPSAPLLTNVYAPTVIKLGRTYRMWFTRVGQNPWVICHATSRDGRAWQVTPAPVLELNQPWELDRLFYPTVQRVEGAYLMWYGSYWAQAKPAQKTALGFAVSLDGLKWHKHPDNPVFRPEPKHDWESHYVTSQSVMKLPDGSWRMWYASRKKPPFNNKYFAIGTARWEGPKASVGPELTLPDAGKERAAFLAAQSELRERLRNELGIPKQRVALEPEARGRIEHGDIVIEKWLFTSEPGSHVTALLYRPKEIKGRLPAIVLTYGHGGSKSTWEHQYAGQLYAKAGVACLAIDPVGEEERNLRGGMGTRAHDNAQADALAAKAGRLMMGKLAFDAMRGIDFLEQREDIDAQRVGVAGYSLGGATAGWVATLDTRVKLALICGWAFDDITLRTKLCTRAPNSLMRAQSTWADYAALAAPRCAMLVMNGDADTVIDTDDDKAAWDGTRRAIRAIEGAYAALGGAGKAQTWFEPKGGHRPYFTYQAALEWIHQHLGTPRMTLEQIRARPTVNAGEWLDARKVQLERLYGTPLHWRGATLPDLGVKYFSRDELAVLRVEEKGQPAFTLEGWLQQISAKTAEKQ